jgi:diguanylate cyclase (GGDEF)-like protein
LEIEGMLLASPVSPEDGELLPYVSAHTRQESEKGNRIHLTRENWREFAYAHKAMSVSKKLDKMLTYLAAKSRYPGDQIVLDLKADYPLFDAATVSEAQFLLQNLVKQGLIAEAGTRPSLCVLNAEGWARAEALADATRTATSQDDWSPLDSTIPQGKLDDLTELGSRGAFDVDLDRYVRASAAAQMPVACMMIDIDDFKQINDTYGHPTGDAALRAVAAAIRSVVHGKGRAYRYGGEEFAVLLFNFAAYDAKGVGERVREAIGGIVIPDVDRSLTVTVGVAIYPIFASDAAQLVKQADDALLSGKRGRKNVAVVYGFDELRSIGKASKQKPPASAEEIEGILQWFESHDPIVRKDAASDLTRLVWQKRIFHHQEVRGGVRRLLKDIAPDVQMEALEIVRVLNIYEKDVVASYYMRTLIEIAEQDPALEVRARAMTVIGVTGNPEYLKYVYRWLKEWDQETYARVSPIAALRELARSSLAEQIRNDLRALIDRSEDPVRQRYVEALRSVAEVIR